MAIMKHIMVIDDSNTIRMSVQHTLKELGYPITQAENGSDGLNKLQGLSDNGEDVALCIVDVNMPEMDGISFVKEFRKNDRFTPVIILTTESGSDRIEEGKQAGASGWLVKPFEPAALKTTVQRLIR